MKRYIKSAIMPLSKYTWQDLAELAGEDTTSSEVLEEIASICKGSVVADMILGNESCTARVLEILAERYIDDAETIYRIAKHPKATKTILDMCAEKYLHREDHWGWDVQRAVASNENTALKTLRKLSHCADIEVLNRIAGNPTASTSLLTYLVNRTDSLLSSVLANPNVDTNLLIKMANRKEYWTRESVASNPNTPIDLLAQLANDENYWVREAVADNPSAPIELLQQLVNDNELEVSTRAKYALVRRGI